MNDKGHERGLHRSEDAAGVFFSGVVLASYATAFLFLANPAWIGAETASARLAFVLGAGFLLGIAGGANLAFNLHNHHHRPFFRSQRANRWFERLTALSAGWPALVWRHMHRAHHEHLLSDEDWTTPRVGSNGRPESLAMYALFRWPWRSLRHLRADLEAGRIADAATARFELKLFAVLWSLPVLLGPWTWLGLWVLPHLVANLIVLAGTSYAWHVGVRRAADTSELTRANSFASPVFDRLAFHAGHAAIHYAHPDLHWSELSDRHAREYSRMVEEGTHVLPYGPFQSFDVFGGLWRTAEAFEEFQRTQARDYGTPVHLRPPTAEPEPATPAAPSETFRAA